MSIRVLVADPHPAFVAGVKAFVAGTDIEVVAEAGDGKRAVELALDAEAAPDVVMLAVRMPEEDGLSAAARIKQARPELPVLVVACDHHPGDLAQAMKLCTSGFLVKDFCRDRLLAAIRHVAAGGTIWSREDERRATGVLTSAALPSNVGVPLTQRECEVLRYVTQGLTNQQIAEQLGISYETVKEHVQHLIRKIGVSDRTQAAVWAVRNGLA